MKINLEKQKAKIKGVIFDFNGVIVNDFSLQKLAWEKVSIKLRGKGVTDREMVGWIRGVPSLEVIRRFGRGKLTEEEMIDWRKKKEKMMIKLYETSPLYRLNLGLKRFLDELKKKGMKRAVATSASEDMARFSFEKLGLGRWFEWEKMVYQDGSHKGKPAPDSYLLAAKKINLKPRECVVFEDAAAGIKAAYKAGVRNIIAVGTDDQVELVKYLPGVKRTIRDFREITVEQIG